MEGAFWPIIAGRYSSLARPENPEAGQGELAQDFRARRRPSQTAVVDIRTRCGNGQKRVPWWTIVMSRNPKVSGSTPIEVYQYWTNDLVLRVLVLPK